MRTTSLDILEKAELPPAQSHAILTVMELEMAAAYDRLATREDLRAEVLGLKNEIASVKAELKADMAAVKGDIVAIRTELSGLSVEFAKMGQRMLGCERETHSIEGKLARWVLTCILGQTAALTGVGYFFLTHFRR